MSPTPLSILAALQEHPQALALREHVAQACLNAAARRETQLALGVDAVQTASWPRDEAQTPYGNVRTILEGGAQNAGEWLLLGGALALWVLEQPEVDTALLSNCSWLAAHTGCSVWPFLALQAPPQLWRDVASAVTGWGVAEQLALAAALFDGDEARLRELKSEWSSNTPYPSVLAQLNAGLPTEPLEGELAPPPRRPWVITLQALSGYLLLRWLARAVGRWVLGYRSRTAVILSPSGLELRHMVTLLGKHWHERKQILPLDEIASIERDVRYQGASLYAGLFALVLGTYVGGGLLVDALRVPSGSPSLLGMGLLMIAAGIALDFALTHWSTYRRGRVRLTVHRHRGRGFRLQQLDGERCQRLLQQVVRLRGFEPHS